MESTLDKLFADTMPGFTSVEPGTLFGNEKYAYLAGLIDGEGYVSIKRYQKKNRKNPVYISVLNITTSNDDLVNYLNKNYDGSVYAKQKLRSHWKDCYTFSFNSSTAGIILGLTVRYMVIKKEQALLVIALAERIKQNFRRGIPYGDDELRVREQMYQFALSLNKRGVRS